MSTDPVPDSLRPTRPTTIEELAAAQNVQPMQSTDEWAADIFKTDDELDAFLEDLRASRNSSIA